MQAYKTSGFGLVGAGEVLLLVLGSRHQCWSSSGPTKHDANREDITVSQTRPLKRQGNVWSAHMLG